MGCKIMVGSEEGQAVLFCSTTMVCFGPVMEDGLQAEKFLAFVLDDPIKYSPEVIAKVWSRFVDEFHCKRCDKWTYEDGGCECPGNK